MFFLSSDDFAAAQRAEQDAESVNAFGADAAQGVELLKRSLSRDRLSVSPPTAGITVDMHHHLQHHHSQPFLKSGVASPQFMRSLNAFQERNSPLLDDFHQSGGNAGGGRQSRSNSFGRTPFSPLVKESATTPSPTVPVITPDPLRPPAQPSSGGGGATAGSFTRLSGGSSSGASMDGRTSFKSMRQGAGAAAAAASAAQITSSPSSGEGEREAEEKIEEKEEEEEELIFSQPASTTLTVVDLPLTPTKVTPRSLLYDDDDVDHADDKNRVVVATTEAPQYSLNVVETTDDDFDEEEDGEI